jgi:hypothetical protein
MRLGIFRRIMRGSSRVGAGSWSLVVALVMPGVGRLFDLHRYDAAFLIAALFPIAGCSV